MHSPSHSAKGLPLRHITALALSLVCCAILADRSTFADEPSAGKQVEQKFAYPANPRHSMGYLLYLPASYRAAEQQKFPLLVFLHGSGERGNRLSLVKRHGPPKIAEEQPDFPFIVVSPQLTLENRFFDPAALAALLDQVEKTYRVDSDRIYVTGLSMGGWATWKLAAYQPERFAAVAPICGWTDTREAVKFKRLPVWAIHGDDDGGVPFMETEQMVDAIRGIGGNVKFTILSNAPHDVWTSTYAMPEFYEWLLRHRKSSLAAKAE
ncbi:carboxylesterase family protein [Schlesneria paludicola]|uniref:carboxylesterase family protein n=1 Tax=Schlesneria paludicola TaxID=360056 RepID=UPI00029A1C07|nr:prolyl oligopeptidase family serine peptidase [Schlesneria paludicola]